MHPRHIHFVAEQIQFNLFVAISNTICAPLHIGLLVQTLIHRHVRRPYGPRRDCCTSGSKLCLSSETLSVMHAWWRGLAIRRLVSPWIFQ